MATLALCVLDAHAAAQRTFVASYGNDANPCSVVAPCRSFGAAVAQTNAGGEVIVLDSAGYGPIALLDKSITIASPAGVYAGIAVLAGNGVVINGTNIEVVLRGLTINGQGGVNGVGIVNAAVVHIENCVIANMSSLGVQSNTGRLAVLDSILRNNYTGIGLYGSSKASIDRSRLEHNTYGLVAHGGTKASVHDSVASGNSVGIFSIADGPGGDAAVAIGRSTVTHNDGIGVAAQSTNGGQVAFVDITSSEVSGNETGVYSIATSGGTARIVAVRNAIVRNNVGIHFQSGTVVVDGNAITQNGTGIHGSTGWMMTRGNNTLRDNGIDDNFSGLTTAFGGY